MTQKIYRNQKGQFTKKETYIKLLIEGIIPYSPTTTTDIRSKRRFQEEENINIGGGPRGGIQGKGQYQAETIILDGGKQIYLVYQTPQQREEIINRILANQISPKDNPREDGTKINRNDKSKLKNERYTTKEIQQRDFKDLVTFTKTEYDTQLKR